MRVEQYEKIRQIFLSHKSWYEILKLLYQFLPWAVVMLYLAMILSLIFHRDDRFFHVLLVPAFVFLAGTGIRSKINAKRPYERKIIPLIPKETKGNSFPSRHLLSVGVILACSIYLNQFIITLFILSILIGVCRILAGVHSFFDVFFGFIFGLFIGLILLFL